MKESAFRTAVLRHLPKAVHQQPMIAGAYGVAGTPDTYLDLDRDIWVEWKVLPREDHLPAVVPTKSMPTDLQQLWLTRRFNAGGNAVVVVGVKLRGRAHGFVLTCPDEWSRPPLRDFYEPRLRPAAELCAYLIQRISQ